MLYFNSVTGKIEDDGKASAPEQTLTIPSGRGLASDGSQDIKLLRDGLLGKMQRSRANSKQLDLDMLANPEKYPYAQLANLDAVSAITADEAKPMPPSMPPMPEEAKAAPMPKALSRKPAVVDTPDAAPLTAAEKVKEYIKSKYGFGEELGDEALVDAQRDASSSRLLAGLGSAANKIGAAIAGTKADTEYYDNMSKTSGQGVKDLMDRRQAKSQDIAMESSQRDLEQKAQLDDPNSDRNVAFRKNLAANFPTLAAKMGKSFEFMTERDLNSVMEPLKLRETIDNRREMMRMATDAKKEAKAQTALKNRDIERLPAEDQEVVKDLAKKNASKTAIANQIDAVMANWDKLPDDQKIMQGRQLIKVLNSTEGADAVGAEEAKRLGGKLETAFGNLTNSNPMQFGRDLPGFQAQAALTSRGIRDAIKMNEKEIARKYNGAGVPRDSGMTSEDVEAIKWAQQNPKDPRASQILKLHGF